MNLNEMIQGASKTNNIIIGYKESRKFIKLNDAKAVVVAKNTPEKMRKEIEHNAGIAGVRLEVFEGTSKELGVICGRPYPVTVLVVK